MRFIPLSQWHRAHLMEAVRAEVPDKNRSPDGPIFRDSWSEVHVTLGEGEGLCGEWQDVHLRWQRGRWVVVGSDYLIA
jgi:hypothetical protein